ncbi:5-oxoprolinase subunit B family protein [Thalassotalea euphylliae]|nr:allophanate hydrolase subunit 1 [Thalassotalea euphylliae]
MSASDIQFDFISEDALLLLWPEQVCRHQHQGILCLQAQLENKLSHYITESLASFNSLLLSYRYQLLSAEQLRVLVEHVIQASCDQENSAQGAADNLVNSTVNNQAQPTPRVITIPAYYGEQAAWDLPYVMQATGLSQQAIIAKHSELDYYAYALGFTPGFAYLASIDSQLRLPRKSMPRKQMPAGAIAIAGEQTAIYPDASPGGWHIIGQCPIPLYQITDEGIESLINTGDTVRFQGISLAEFEQLGGVIALESESTSEPTQHD